MAVLHTHTKRTLDAQDIQIVVFLYKESQQEKIMILRNGRHIYDWCVAMQ